VRTTQLNSTRLTLPEATLTKLLQRQVVNQFTTKRNCVSFGTINQNNQIWIALSANKGRNPKKVFAFV
jgi:hypothetical protein